MESFQTRNTACLDPRIRSAVSVERFKDLDGSVGHAIPAIRYGQQGAIDGDDRRGWPIRRRRWAEVTSALAGRRERTTRENDDEKNRRTIVRRQRSRANGWHSVHTVGADLNLGLHSTRPPSSSIAARIRKFWQCQPGVREILRTIVACIAGKKGIIVHYATRPPWHSLVHASDARRALTEFRETRKCNARGEFCWLEYQERRPFKYRG